MSDRQTHRQIADEVQKALEPLGQKFGGVFKLARGRFDPNGGDVFKIEFAPRSAFGLVLDNDARTFQLYAPLNGFKSEELGKVVHLNGEDYRIVGLRPARKQSVLVEKLSDGKRYFFEQGAVLRALKAEVAA